MRFPFMLMFTTRLVVVARKLKRRVHAFIESIDTCHRDFIEFAYSNSTSGAKVFDVFENWVTSAWCVFRAFGFSFRQLFSPFRSPFFFLLFFISCTNRSNSSLFSGEEFFAVRSLRWPRRTASTPNYYAKRSLSLPRHHYRYVRGLPFSQGFCNLNIQTFSYLAPIFVSLVSIFIYRVLITEPFHSSLLLSTFQFLHPPPPAYILFSLACFFSFSLLFLFSGKQKEGGEEKIAHSGATISGIGNEFNELASSHPFRVPAVPPTEPRFSAYPLRLVEKRHRLVLRIRVESWPGNRAYERTPFIARRRPPSFTPPPCSSTRLDRAEKIGWEELREVEDE